MNQTTKANFELSLLHLERMAEGKFPFSEIPADENSDLYDVEVNRSFRFIINVLNEVREEIEKKRPKTTRQSFPLECLSEFKYEGDKSIMPFVAQLKQLAGDPKVKGISTKRITDWLKTNGYLGDSIDSATGSNNTIITSLGEEAGLYSEVRYTRFGQEYEVIMYSEKAQIWLIENMETILR